MKLLIVTQKISKKDTNLGFFHQWVIEFAKKYDKVTVICLEMGEYDLPKNVKVRSLGKEKGVSRLKYIFNFYKYIWQERKNYEKVFVHMNQIYAILGGLFWKVRNNKIALWYTHSSVPISLRVAEKIVDKIFTASEKSFRLKSKKKNVVGHGIDTELFKPGFEKKPREVFNILSVGRISRIKNQKLFIDVTKILREKEVDFSFNIIGEGITIPDKKYVKELKEEIKKGQLDKYFNFLGSISHNKLAKYYQENDLFINLSETGSIDKAVLEAMSSGMKILTSNEAFKDILNPNYFSENEPREIADKIIKLKNENHDSLRGYVMKEHSLKKLIDKLKI